MPRNKIYDCACPSDLYRCGGIAPIKATDDMTQAVGQRNGQLFTLPANGTVPDPGDIPDGYVLTASGGEWIGEKIPKELPTVTIADNGKVLRVVNGVWAAAQLPPAEGVDF